MPINSVIPHIAQATGLVTPASECAHGSQLKRQKVVWHLKQSATVQAACFHLSARV